MSLTAVFVTFGVIFLAELPDKTMVASLVLGSRFRPLYVWAGVATAFLIHVTVAVAAGSAFSLLPGRLVDVITACLFVVGAVLVLREGRPDEIPAGDSTAPTRPGPLAASRTGAPSPAEPSATDGLTGTSTAEAVASGASAPGILAAGPSDDQAAGPGAAEGGFWRVAATSFTVVFLAELGDLTQISTANLAARFASPFAVGIGAVLALWTVAGLAIAGGRSLLRLLSITVITRIAAAAFAVLAVFSAIEAVRG